MLGAEFGCQALAASIEMLHQTVEDLLELFVTFLCRSMQHVCAFPAILHVQHLAHVFRCAENVA